MAIDFDLVKEIKQRADIVDVISFYLPSVQKKGKNYKAICPFHDDHDPSMDISKEKQSFHCWVDGAGGDVFSFVQQYEKCGFEEAVRKVCEIIGFDDPRLHKATYQPKVDENLVPVYNCINELQKLYKLGLYSDEGEIARNYLDKRGLSEEQRQKFDLGYSLKEGQKTVQYLQKKGFSLKNIQDIGIAHAKTEGTADNNQGRLIFPIKDSNGQVCGFSARKIIEDPDAPKYVNSPETVIFTKSKILYNYHQAKQTAKHDGYIYVVEGFMDVFALDCIGITSCVALMSTKLTEPHIDLLKRLGVEIRLCLDGDKPGQQAMMKIMGQLDKTDLAYRVVSLPGEVRDPDEILKQSGEEELKKFVNTLVDPFNFALNYYKNTSPLETIEDKKKVVRHFLPMIKSQKDKLVQDDYIYKLVEVTGFSESAIRNSVNYHSSKTDATEQVISNVNVEIRTDLDFKKISKDLRRLTLAERTVLDLMFVDDKAISFYETDIKYFMDEIYRQIANSLVEHFKKTGDLNPSLVMDEIRATDVKNKESVLSELSAISFRKDKAVYSEQTLEDCKNVISKERTRIYEKKAMEKECEGKTPQERAKIIAEYLAKQNKQ